MRAGVRLRVRVRVRVSLPTLRLTLTVTLTLTLALALTLTLTVGSECGARTHAHSATLCAAGSMPLHVERREQLVVPA